MPEQGGHLPSKGDGQRKKMSGIMSREKDENSDK